MTVPGSDQSISLIEVLLEAQDEVFDTKIIYIIEDKWDRVVGYLQFLSIVFIVYILILSCHITFYQNNRFIVYGIFAFQILYFTILQLPYLIKQQQYFYEASNWLDLMSTIGVCSYCI